MTSCTCPSSVTSRGTFSIRHSLDCPTRPAWCVGMDRPPHVVEGVRPRKPHALPMCDPCALAATTRKDTR